MNQTDRLEVCRLHRRRRKEPRSQTKHTGLVEMCWNYCRLAISWSPTQKKKKNKKKRRRRKKKKKKKQEEEEEPEKKKKQKKKE